MIPRALVFIVSALLSCSTWAADLLEVYQDAIANDPQLQQAYYHSLSTAEGIPHSVARLLPNLSINANTTANRREMIETPAFAPIEGKLHYNSHAYQLVLSQSIFDLPSWLRVHQAKTTAKSTLADYAAAQQNLALRVTKAYFDVLLAQDNLRFIRIQKRATQKHLAQAREKYKLGLTVATELDAAQVDYDLIVANEIAANNQIRNSNEALHTITGHYYSHLSPLSKTIPLPHPHPHSTKAWSQIALIQNRTLLAANYNLQAAKENIRQTFASHLPTVSALGTMGRVDSGNASGAGTNKTALTSIAIEANLPLFSGFSNLTSTRQAHFDYKQAMAVRDQALRTTLANTHQLFNNVVSGISQTKADRNSVNSTRKALQSTRSEFEVGTRTLVDVLDAQQDFYHAQSKAAKDQYDFLNNSLALKEAAGILCLGDLKYINTLLTPPSKH